MVDRKILFQKSEKIKMLITDIDGVMTDTGVYYSSIGEELKRFSIRDGMGVERLRTLVSVKTGIITGENSLIVSRRAEKLGIEELHLGIKNKADILKQICKKRNLSPEEIAYIGDDTNDIDIIKLVGMSAAPNDAMPEVKAIVDFVTENRGGNGAFRDFCELIIFMKTNKDIYE